VFIFILCICLPEIDKSFYEIKGAKTTVMTMFLHMASVFTRMFLPMIVCRSEHDLYHTGLIFIELGESICDIVDRIGLQLLMSFYREDIVMSESEAFSCVVEIFTLKEIYFLDFLYDCIRKETRYLFFYESLILFRHYHVKIELIFVGDVFERECMLATEFVEYFA
jgi:hypothetical protein